MALQAAYKRFLAAPSSSELATDASLHYITSTTSFAGATEIIKHLGTLRNQVKKKGESVLFVIEGQNTVVLESQTTLEFVTSGGTYLPGLDDNFLTDRTVQIPITHIVTFNDEGKITQIRQSWDQGSLLKQLEVIGKSGRNWPIRDSKDQIALIAKCVQSGGGAGPVPATEDRLARSRGNSTNILRDPHASLALFAPREEVENLPAPVVSPFAGRRPRQRSFTEILGDEPVEEPDSPSGRGRSQSPSKAIAPKVGAGKNFQPIRLFEADESAEAHDTPERNYSPDRMVRPNPKKYEHFDFDDGSEGQPASKQAADDAAAKKTKHNSSWSFEDFVTPQKPKATRTLHKARDVRHWGTEDDVVEDTPAQKPQVVKPRRDAEAHFEFVDDGPLPEGPRAAGGKPRGEAHNTGLHLYENNLYNEDGSAPSPGPAPLGNITNLKDRRKDFAAHFDFTDESPHHKNGTKGDAVKISDDRKKAVRMMESNWESYDQSPVSASFKENNNPNARRTGDDRGIVTAGDGMGGRKGAGRGWGIGDDSDDEHNAVRAVPGKKQGPPAKSDFWDF